jgi:hypothetical protein
VSWRKILPRKLIAILDTVGMAVASQISSLLSKAEMNKTQKVRLTKEDIVTLISSRTEESLTLEYKRAEALANQEMKRNEISKDVAAMANSAGGKILYGIMEDPTKRFLPGTIDPVQRTSITTETLQQIIESRIQPKISGINIYAVPITDETAIYVVDVPQGTTAHQASDKKYYKRVNNVSCPMEDYEIRDVMNRKTAITLSLELIPDLTRNQERTGSEVTYRFGMNFLVSVKNSDDRVAKYCLVELSADQYVIYESTGDSYFTETDGRLREIFNFSNDRIVDRRGDEPESLVGGQYHPILPNCERRLGWITVTDNRIERAPAKPAVTFFPVKDYIIFWKIFSDEGQPNYGEVDLRDLVARHNAMVERVSKNTKKS